MTLTNKRHEQFAREYARTGNGKQSYIKAGYSSGGAEVSASRLLRNAKVRARVNELKQAITAGVVKAEISQRSARIQALQDRWERMRAVIDARASDQAAQEAPGGKTGLLVRQLKKIGSGKDAEIVEEFTVDAALLRELREHEKQAGQELGQWARTVTLSLPEGIATTEEISRALAAVLQAIARAEITPDEGARLASILETRRKVIETDELEARIVLLEKTAAEHRGR